MTISALPDLDQLDNDALKALAIQLESELRQQRETAAQQEAELVDLEAEFAAQRLKLAEQGDELRTRSEQIEHLKLLVEKLRRTIFGKKSEKIVVQLEQFELELEELETAQAAAETAADAARPEVAPKARPRRKPLPSHLERQAVTHTPEHESCPDCGGSLKQFGEDVSEQLEYVPESFKVIRHVRPKFACAACERVVEAPAPSRPIERGLAGPALLAHVLVSKYCDHQPLYRQSEIYARQGVEIERSTLAGWVSISTTFSSASSVMAHALYISPSMSIRTRAASRQHSNWPIVLVRTVSPPVASCYRRDTIPTPSSLKEETHTISYLCWRPRSHEVPRDLPEEFIGRT